ncbi:hypothetical protein [uncultured Fibrobacter sp.]|uniref:hypothetical protein n=1 Tax=uncultured Fibrobacter sp. TaxID=261512 RepID=UPI00261A6070|nr:hypothetical protein [uncultured Fibrobacter sp.]
MVRKFLGMLCLSAFVMSVIGCGSSSSGSDDDECTKDPNSPNCIQEDPAEDPVAL